MDSVVTQLEMAMEETLDTEVMEEVHLETETEEAEVEVEVEEVQVETAMVEMLETEV